MAIAGLTHPTLVECNGIMYVTGYRGGAVYLRRTADGGKTWLTFADGTDEKLVGSPADEARAGLVKLESQGRRLMVAISCKPSVNVYVSADDGESWVTDSSV
jgi:hypothetical protein